MISSMRYTVSPSGPGMAVQMIGRADTLPFALFSISAYTSVVVDRNIHNID